MTRHAQIPDSRITWPPGHSPSSSIVLAQNTIEIAATPEKVWAPLIDCVSWPFWYKHCTDVSVLRGGPVLSAKGKFRFKTIGFYFEPDVVTFSPYRLLIWVAKGPVGTSGAPHDSPHFPSAQPLRRFAPIPYQIGGFRG
jgi:hypothetical protein